MKSRTVSSDRLSVTIPKRVRATMVIITLVHLGENIYIYYECRRCIYNPYLVTYSLSFQQAHASFARTTLGVSGNEPNSGYTKKSSFFECKWRSQAKLRS